MSTPALIGLDVGTTNLKGVCFTAMGQTLARMEVPTPRYHPREGWTEWNPGMILGAVLKLIQSLVQQLPAGHVPVGISVASVAESVVGIDRAGQATGPIIAWHDRRSEPEAEWLRSQMSEEDIYAITGSPLDATFSLFKILWLKKARLEQFDRAVRWLCIADWVAFCFTGEMATSTSLATRTSAFDLSKLTWSGELLEAAGLHRESFAEVRPSGACVGKVTAEVAVRCGLPKHVVVAVGGHDHVCGAIAAGAVRPGVVLDSIGTSEALLVPISGPRTGAQFLKASFCQGVVSVGEQPPAYYAIGGMPSAGESVEWFLKLLQGDKDIATLSKPASRCEPGRTLFIPHLRFVSGPSPHNNSRGAFFGLTIETTAGELFRAVLEGITFESKYILDNLISMAGTEPATEVWCVGKAFQTELFQEIKANVNGVPLHVAEQPDLAARGAALLAGLAAGTYSSLEEALGMIRGDWSKSEPNEDQQEVYRLGYARYVRVRESVRLLTQELY